MLWASDSKSGSSGPCTSTSMVEKPAAAGDMRRTPQSIAVHSNRPWYLYRSLSYHRRLGPADNAALRPAQRTRVSS